MPAPTSALSDPQQDRPGEGIAPAGGACAACLACRNGACPNAGSARRENEIYPAEGAR